MVKCLKAPIEAYLNFCTCFLRFAKSAKRFSHAEATGNCASAKAFVEPDAVFILRSDMPINAANVLFQCSRFDPLDQSSSNAE